MGLFVLLNHLVHLRILVKPVHGKIRASTPARETEITIDILKVNKLIEIMSFFDPFPEHNCTNRGQHCFTSGNTFYFNENFICPDELIDIG